MVEANLKVTLGQCSRDDALAWVLKQEPNMFELPRQERLDWAFRERAS
jgi:hypothetical protein